MKEWMEAVGIVYPAQNPALEDAQGIWWRRKMGGKEGKEKDKRVKRLCPSSAL